MANFMVANFDDIPAIPCPCGSARRAFAVPENHTATMHMVEIKEDSETHYHKKTTEIYYILEGQGEMELDGQRVPVVPGSAIFIKPGCRHRAIGKLKILNVPIPAFDESDEWFD
jgi:mannose-6-phosphate isomerase-like protein (cupin superfamily)